jgi:transcriptional regulator with XRE-family HTH domain
MLLSDHIRVCGLRRYQAAEQLGISVSAVSDLCNGKHWPGREMAMRIREWSRGLVTPNDFLPPYVARPAGDMPGEAGDREGENLALPAADLCPAIGEPA